MNNFKVMYDPKSSLTCNRIESLDLGILERRKGVISGYILGAAFANADSVFGN